MRSVPFSVWRLMFAYALMMGGIALTVLIAGIVGTHFAPTPGLATLPIALTIVGVAVIDAADRKVAGQFWPALNVSRLRCAGDAVCIPGWRSA